MRRLVIKLHEHRDFRIGAVFHLTKGFIIAFGWIGFEINWEQPKCVLIELPATITEQPCSKCGEKDFTAFNLTEQGIIADCNKCGGYPGGPQ